MFPDEVVLLNDTEPMEESAIVSPTVGNCPARSSFLPIMVSLASLIGCLYVIGTYLHVRALRQHPAGIMFGMSVYGAIYQFLYLLDRASTSVHCSQMAIFVDFFLTGQETYMLIFAIDLLMALKNPFSASKGQMKKYHIFGGLWSISCAVISQFDTHYALFGFCWVNYSGQVFGGVDTADGFMTTESTETVKLSSGAFFALYVVVVYCTSLVALLRTWNTFLKGLPDTFKTRHRIHRHLKYYVVCYFGYWTLVLACYAAFTLVPHDETDSSGGLRCRLWHLLSCLLLAKGMVNSVIWTRTSNILKIIEQLRNYGYVDLPPHEDSINWALRLEIVTNTTKGICEGVDRAERQARASAVSSVSDTGGTNINTNTNTNSDIDYCDRKESYSQIEEIILENRNASGSRGQRSEGVVFYDYAPHVFRRLRMEAKISATSYRDSMKQTSKERVSEGKSGAFFYFTEDRKYVVKTMTHEELKFLLQILPKYYSYMKNNQNTFVTRFLGCHAVTMYGKTVFFMVMQSVFDTTLQIHERFDLKGSWVGRLEGRKPTGTIATCKFCSRDYVVGGSHDQLCAVRRGEGNLRHQYDQVGKDLNWNRHMALPRPTARAVARQLTKDSDFLAKINCIDYSLLVGIHHRSFNVSHYSSAETIELPRASSCSATGYSGGPSYTPTKAFHQAINGGMTVDEVHGPGIYFMGLIDMLQQWNLRKRVEHFVRAYILMQDKHGISVVNPKQYAERFQQRVLKELIYDGSIEVDEAAVHPHHPYHYQTPLHELFDPSMFESGRTLSTVLNSFDTGYDPLMTSTERLSTIVASSRGGGGQTYLPTITSMQSLASTASIPTMIPVMPLPSTRSTEPRPRGLTSSLASSPEDSDPPIRLSGGLVMEAPMSYFAPRPSIPVLFHPNPYTSSPRPTCVDLPSQLRRQLAPLTPSPRLSGPVVVHRTDRSDSESSNTSGGSQDRASTSAQASTSVTAASCLSHGSSGNSTTTSTPPPPMSIETTSTTLTDSPHSYRIVQTPTFPDKLITTSGLSSA